MDKKRECTEERQAAAGRAGARQGRLAGTGSQCRYQARKRGARQKAGGSRRLARALSLGFPSVRPSGLRAVAAAVHHFSRCAVQTV